MQGEPLNYKVFFYLIAYSGFRRSEMLGLEWKDIDFEHNIISIKRTLKIAQPIMDMIEEYKAEQDEEALRLGDKWIETDRLFTKWNGAEMNNQTPYG